MDNSNAVGTAAGAGLGLFKSLLGISVMTALTWTVLIEAAILGLIGGILGWCGSELMKVLKRFFLKR